MLNYEIDPAMLAPLVPAGTSLDAWHGRTFVSLVGFRFLDTALHGLRIPGHQDFEEVNLRFYVRRDLPGESRRAVVFIREFVPRFAIAAVARLVYHETYTAAPMRSAIQPDSAEYAWRVAGRWHRLAARYDGGAAVPAPGTLEEFITAHYWGYTRQRDGGTVEYRVEHPPWRVWSATDAVFEADAAALYGAGIAAALVRPASAFVADGSPVTVFRPTRI